MQQDKQFHSNDLDKTPFDHIVASVEGDLDELQFECALCACSPSV